MLPNALDLNLLRVFDAVHDARNVSRAAERLGMTQPAASAALARLRTVLGDPLFVRVGGAMQPTPKALRLAPVVGRALRDLHASVADETPFVSELSDRQFTLASTDYTSMVILPGLAAALATHAPGVDLRVIGYDKGDVPALIDRGEIDVALGVFRAPSERAVCQSLCPERFVGLARRGHPRIVDGRMSVEDYAAASHALVTVRRDATGEIDAALRELGWSRRIALTLPHMLALPDVLRTTDLVAAVPGRVADAVAGMALQRFPLPLALPEWTIEMMWNPAARGDPASAWLRRQIQRAAAAVDEGPASPAPPPGRSPGRLR